MLLWKCLYFFVSILKVFCEERVIGGNLAIQEKYSYQASLRNITTGQYFCGGSIISETWVLTAGHCMTNETPETFVVFAGSIYLNSTGSIMTNVSSVIVHKHFDSTTLACDIAVINVITPFIYTRNIQPIKLASQNNLPSPRTYAILTGWGRIYESPFNIAPSNQLKVLFAKYISIEECQKYNPINGICLGQLVTNQNVCTLNDIGKGTCYGDSGSPLVYNFKQIGIVSFIHYLCSTSRPSVYTSVPHFRHWISEKTGIS